MHPIPHTHNSLKNECTIYENMKTGEKMSLIWVDKIKLAYWSVRSSCSKEGEWGE